MRKRIGRRAYETVCSALALMAAGALPLAGCATAQEVGEAAEATPVAGQTVAAEATRMGLTGEERVDYIIARMTLTEKLGQLNQVPGGRQKAPNSLVTPEVEQALRDGKIGSFLNVTGADATERVQRIAVEESRLGIPVILAMDIVHGYRTLFPVPLALAASFDPAVPELAARVAAVEASASGLHWTFAPMVDISRDGRWGRVVEGAGEEPYFGSVMAVAQIEGYQGGDLSRPDTIAATAKHFGAYGFGTGGRDYDSADISERTLMEVALAPFYAAAKAGSGTFMVAFNDIGGVPTTGNKALVNDLLRGEWGYQGFIVSDWMSVEELMKHGVAADRTEAGTLALLASVDMEMSSGIYIADMEAAVAASPELQAAVDASVKRVLMVKDALGLFDAPYQYVDAGREAASMVTPEHRAAARLAAERSMVLLRNEDGLLPLAAEPGRVALIGALGDDARSMLGSWKALGEEGDVVTLKDALEARLGDGLVYEPGAPTRGEVDDRDLKAAVAAAKSADTVILVIGEDYDYSGEARARSDISIPAPQLALAEAVFATGKPVVVVLMNGRPLDLSPLEADGTTLLEAWLPGIEAGPAIASTLFGEVSPAGRLPMSFPRASGSNPWSIGHYPTGRPADPDPTRDTARYTDVPITPAYAFGYGLSYAAFEYSGLTQSTGTLAPDGTITLSVDVTNTSATDSDEVVQLYVRDPVARVARPMQEMRGFARVAVPAGETKTVSFTLSPEQFAYYAPSGRYEVDAGVIEYGIGASSDDIRLSGQFEIEQSLVADGPAAAIETVTVIGP